MEEVKRGRAKKKLVKVTFPSGKVICYKSTTDKVKLLRVIGAMLHINMEITSI